MVKQRLTKLIHPVYLKCSNLEQDPFWKQFFVDLAHGKVPRNLFITPGGDIFRYKKSVKLVAMESKTAAELLVEIKKVMISIGVCPHNKSKLEPRYPVVYDKWSSIRKAAVRDFFLLKYFAETKKDPVKARLAYKQLSTGLLLGNFGSVSFCDGSIKSIDMSQKGKTKPSDHIPNVPSGYLMSNFWKVRA